MNGNKIALGIILEKWVFAVLKSLFKAREGFRVLHVNWQRYNYGHGQDLRVFQRNRQILAIECKNWRMLNRPYGTDICETEIIDRFKNHAGGIKLLIITFADLLTKKARNLLKQHNVHIIETCKLIGKRDFPRKHHFVELFYQVKQQITHLLSRPKKVLFGSGLYQSKLVTDVSNFVSDDTDTGSNRQQPILEHLLLPHDTDSKKQLVRTQQNNLVERILNLAIQARKKENQYEAHGFWQIPIEKE